MATEEKVKLSFEIQAQANQMDALLAKFKELGAVGVDSATKTNVANTQGLGIIGKLTSQLDELKKSRDKANDIDSIQVFNKAIQETQDKVKELQAIGEQSEEKLGAGTKE